MTETVVITKSEYLEYQELKRRCTELSKRVASLTDYSALLCRMLFGRSSEQTKYAPDNACDVTELSNQMTLEFGDSATSSVPQENDESSRAEVSLDDGNSTVSVQHHKHLPSTREKVTLRQAVSNSQPAETITYELSEGKQICPCCGGRLHKIGVTTRKEVVTVPAKHYTREIEEVAYDCELCKRAYNSAHIVRAKAKPSVLPGTYASEELISYVAVQKYDMGCPVYRLARSCQSSGYPLTRQTLNSYLIAADKLYAMPMVKALHKHLLEREVLFADETPFRVLRDKDGNPDHSNSFMWVCCTGKDELPPIVLYKYYPTREAANIRNLLEGFSGYLHSDGYQGYHSLPSCIANSGCWSHARRKCDHANRQDGNKQKTTIASQSYQLCNELFDIERDIKGLPPDHLLKERRERAKPILDKLQDLVENSGHIVHEATRKAVKHLRTQWQYLLGYLADGRLEISNNRAERYIKLFVINRKNCMFANCPDGAEASADWMTLIVTARENGLDPYKYLVWFLKNAPSLAEASEDWPEKLMPWLAPEECRAQGNT